MVPWYALAPLLLVYRQILQTSTEVTRLYTSPKFLRLVDIPFLDSYARETWESVLHLLVGTPSSKDTKKPTAVMLLLENSGLMGRPEDNPKAELVITRKGFQFLLQDVRLQVWAFLMQYIQLSSTINMDPVDVLGFLLSLGSMELGCDYSTEVLTDTQRSMLNDLKHLGLVYQRKVCPPYRIDIHALEKEHALLPYPARHNAYLQARSLGI